VNAPARKLRSQLDPWDLPVTANFYAPPDHFASIEDEEAILSYAITNPGRVTSLKPADFTGADRPLIYAALLAGKTLAEIQDMPDLELGGGYVTDLFLHPVSSKRALKEMVQNLKRLTALRALRDDVMRWLNAAPTMTVRGAQCALALSVRRSAERCRE